MTLSRQKTFGRIHNIQTDLSKNVNITEAARDYTEQTLTKQRVERNSRKLKMCDNCLTTSWLYLAWKGRAHAWIGEQPVRSRNQEIFPCYEQVERENTYDLWQVTLTNTEHISIAFSEMCTWYCVNKLQIVWNNATCEAPICEWRAYQILCITCVLRVDIYSVVHVLRSDFRWALPDVTHTHTNVKVGVALLLM